MKRNVLKRALRTFAQAAVPAAAAVIYAAIQSGDVGASMLWGAVVAGGAAGFSALQNWWDNRDPVRANSQMED